jgi:hypothetical protein
VSFVLSFENWGSGDGAVIRPRPSFPHAFSGNPGGIGTGPPIGTFGGDAFSSSVGERKLMTHFVVNKTNGILRGDGPTGGA